MVTRNYYVPILHRFWNITRYDLKFHSIVAWRDFYDDLRWLDVPQRITFKLSAGYQLFTRLGTAVSCRAMCRHTGCRRHGAPKSALRNSMTTKFSLIQHDKLWSTSILVRRPSCLELTVRTSAINYFDRPFQALSENVQRIGDILFIGLYKFTLLTYLLTYLYWRHHWK